MPDKAEKSGGNGGKKNKCKEYERILNKADIKLLILIITLNVNNPNQSIKQQNVQVNF